MSDSTFALGNCFLCERPFTFDPDLVPSIYVDPETRRPPDVDEDGNLIETVAKEAIARAFRVPLCRDCVTIANAARRLTDRPLIEILPGAYSPNVTDG